jgi:hypothetical protein
MQSRNELRLIQEATASSVVPGAALSAVRPPLPQIDPWRPRDGYMEAPERQPTISEVLGSSRVVTPAVPAFSGGPGSYSGSSVNSFG